MAESPIMPPRVGGAYARTSEVLGGVVYTHFIKNTKEIIYTKIYNNWRVVVYTKNTPENHKTHIHYSFP